MEQQELWHENRKTIPQQETQPESQSQSSNENTAAEAEEQMKLLIGQMLRLSSFTGQLLLLQEQAVQSSSVTPVTEVHLSSVLLGTASLLMSTSDLLRTYHSTWKHLSQITLSERALDELLWNADDLVFEARTAANR